MSDLRTTFYRAMDWAKSCHENASEQKHYAFGAAVAQLCHDDPRLPPHQRAIALGEFLKISGGPSVRETAVLWAACGQGDAVRVVSGNQIRFQADERFPLPGTWPFETACRFAEPIVYGPLTQLHRDVWQHEPDCYDDDPDDLKALSQD